MALGPRLDLRQSQSLVMTPQLQQAIRLLALSNIEVEAFIAGELERNPLLDMARGEGEADGPAGAASPDAGALDVAEGAAPTPGGEAEMASDAMLGSDAPIGDTPLDLDPVPFVLSWHRRNDAQPAQRWLRECVVALTARSGIGSLTRRARRGP